MYRRCRWERCIHWYCTTLYLLLLQQTTHIQPPHANTIISWWVVRVSFGNVIQFIRKSLGWECWCQQGDGMFLWMVLFVVKYIYPVSMDDCPSLSLSLSACLTQLTYLQTTYTVYSTVVVPKPNLNQKVGVCNNLPLFCSHLWELSGETDKESSQST